jgi:hypothetical protein
MIMSERPELDIMAVIAEREAKESQEAAAIEEDRLLFHELRAQRIRRRAREILDAEQRGSLPPFDAGFLGDMLARPPQPGDRVQGLAKWEGDTLIPAQRKTGKTTFMLNLARSLVLGEPFLGRFEVKPVDGVIAYMNYEMSGDMIAGWAKDLGIPPDRLFLVNLRGRRNPLTYPEDRDALTKLFRNIGTESLIADTFGRAYTGASQNDSGEVGAWLASLDRWARGDVGVLDLFLTNHAGWDGERSRGASGLEDWPDSIITLLRGGRTKGDGGENVRYVKAIGRDVDLDEDRLSYDEETRQLTLAGTGSRKAAATKAHNDELDRAVLRVITASPGVIAGDLAPLVRDEGVGFQRGEERQAAGRLVDSGKAYIVYGKRNAKHYYSIDYSQPSQPLPTTPDGTLDDPDDPSRHLPTGRGRLRSSPEPTPPETTCAACGESMKVIEPGQTTHPGCEP